MKRQPTKWKVNGNYMSDSVLAARIHKELKVLRVNKKEEVFKWPFKAK